jgi:meso-butanediol dehydrogenase/(S,S)-butanediol dehydrogenase/diacetyl reductase
MLFAQEGAKAAIVARRAEHLGETEARIRDAGGDVLALPADVASQAQAERVVQETVERFGRVDVLYSGGGGFFEPGRDFDQVDADFWHRAIANTLDGIFNLTHAVRPLMKQQGGGAIVVVTASWSVRQESNPAYGAAKGGVIGFAQNLARELHGDNIRVNVIAPGLIRGRLGDGPIAPAAERTVARRGFPQDIAYAALYFASDESSWVTGQVLAVDGGVDVGARGLWEMER